MTCGISPFAEGKVRRGRCSPKMCQDYIKERISYEISHKI